ncbi:MAG: FtsX-like permease family protein [Campylobacterota bacterium]|nr:FtsX-like permease family protein [Campylobacterota bacterium]
MKNKINIYLIEYAINAILRQKYKSLFITVVFTILTFLLTSVFFITNSIKHELNSTVDALPQIVVQKVKAGKSYDIDVDAVDNILSIAGVSDAVARVWGYYLFENINTNLNVNFTLIGVEQFENQYKNSLNLIVEKTDFETDEEMPSMVLGKGVKDIMSENYYKEYFNFIKPDGDFKKVSIAGVFDADTQLESNDMIVMSKDILREIFDMPESKATDIVVKVANPEEIPTIALKIKQLYPDVRVVTNEDLKVSYENIFNYKGGVFLALFIISLFTFFMIVYDKASGLSGEQKKEIGILKAIGWRVDDVLKEKFYESFIISFFSYTLGVTISFAFVYLLQAPILRNIFVGYSELKTSFELPFIFDVQTLFLVFFLSVPIYVGATIIPSWRIATLEADEVIR